jgi:hypothetical protein
MERLKNLEIPLIFVLIVGFMYYLDSLKNGGVIFNNNISNENSEYDFKLVVIDNRNDKVNFLTHKYILATNSDYFKTLLSTNKSLDSLTFYNVNTETFKYITDMIYHSQFQTPAPLPLLPEIADYMDKFRILNKNHKYLDKTFANNIQHSHIYNISNVATNIYPKIKQFEFTLAREALLNRIYTDWRKQPSFNATYVEYYPELFYDYVKKFDC